MFISIESLVLLFSCNNKEGRVLCLRIILWYLGEFLEIFFNVYIIWLFKNIEEYSLDIIENWERKIKFNKIY